MANDNLKVKYNTVPVVRLPRDTEPTAELVDILMTSTVLQSARYKELQDYYEGKQEILKRVFNDTSKPNNRIVNNFASYITDINTGYFSGIPITYMTDDLDYYNKLNDLFVTNNEPDENTELDKQCNIKGHCFELLWINEEGDLKFKRVNPDNIVMVYSSDIEEIPLMALRYYDQIDILTQSLVKRIIYLYTSTTVYVYEQNFSVTGRLYENSVLVEQYSHLFNELPVIEYQNNEERIGTFEDVISLINAYNVTQSDSVNELEYFNDAYLVLKNLLSTTEEDIADMKTNRVMKIDGDGEVEWLVKNVNDKYIENLKERLEMDIHKFSKTPNLVSDQFVSNLSGTAIKYKVWGLEQTSITKERKWIKAIRKRLKLITFYLNLKNNSNFDYKTVDIVFNRNLPENVTELGQMVSQLRGTVSRETILSQVPFVENVQEEIDRINTEEQRQLDIGLLKNYNVGN